MLTPTLDSASRLLELLFMDSIQIMDVGAPQTQGFEVIRSTTNVGQPVDALVQTTTLDNAVESATNSVYSVKVALHTDLKAGQAVKVLNCIQQPDLIGKVLYIDKVSQNGMAVLRKAVASEFKAVNQEGKEGLQ